MIRDPYARGYALDANPYPPGTADHARWERAWYAGRDREFAKRGLAYDRRLRCSWTPTRAEVMEREGW